MLRFILALFGLALRSDLEFAEGYAHYLSNYSADLETRIETVELFKAQERIRKDLLRVKVESPAWFALLKQQVEVEQALDLVFRS